MDYEGISTSNENLEMPAVSAARLVEWSLGRRLECLMSWKEMAIMSGSLPCQVDTTAQRQFGGMKYDTPGS